MIKKNIVSVPFVFLNRNDKMCVFLLYILIVLKLCIFSLLYFLHCVIVFASFFYLCTSCTILIIIIIIEYSRPKIQLEFF